MTLPKGKWGKENESGNENGIEFHKQIIATLRSQDGEKAEKLMRQHLEESVENYYSGEQ